MTFIRCILWLMVVGSSLALVAHDDLPAQTTQTELIPRSLLFGNPEKAAPRISPDGSKLAYLAPDSHGVLNVWVRDLNHPESSDQKVTSDQKRGVRSFFWQIDGKQINYMQDQDGDENWHLFQADLETKMTRELTPFKGVKVGILDYDHKFPDELLITMNKRNPTLFDVYRLNLKAGDLKLDTENPGGVFNWVADHNLQVRASQSYAKDGSTLIHVRDTINSPWRELLSVGPNETGANIISFTPDNGSIYVLTSLDGNTERLLKIDLIDGKRSLVVEDPEFDLSDVLIHPTTYALEAIGVNKERYEWIAIDSNLKLDFNELSRKLKTPFLITNGDLANQNWIVASLSDVRPTRFFLYQRSKKTLTFLFSTQPALENYTLSPMEPMTFQARDGMKLHAYLTLPAGKEPKNLPAILLVHGGPWVRDDWGYNPQVQWLANRGYAVFQINYRGSTGYGKSYLNAGNREWAGKMHTDLLDGKEWLVKKGYADPEKVSIYGGSYGGYATLVGLAFTPDAFCCGVDIVGPSNLITLLQTLPPYWSPVKAEMDIRLGNLEKDAEFLKSRSPLHKAEMIKKPLLIAQGANDPRVNQAESDQIVSAMRQNKLPVEYLLFSDEGHGFARPENKLKFYSAAEDFFAKYLGGRFEPPSAEENWDSLKR